MSALDLAHASVRSEPAPHARVIMAENTNAVVAFSSQAERVEDVFDRGLLAFTGKASREEAWRSIVSTQDTVGIKVVSGPGANSGTRPSVVAAAVKGLLAAGLPPRQIVIWDKHMSDLRRATFVDLAGRLGIDVASSAEAGYDDKAFYDTALLAKQLIWGDHDFGKHTETAGRRSYVSKLITRRLTKIINVTPLLNHNLAGVSGNLYTLSMDSVDNTIRFESSPEYLAQAVPEIYALESLGDKVVLNVVDALICQYQGEERSLLHYSTMLGQIRFGTDPVALDILSIAEIERQRTAAKIQTPKPTMKIYSNAALLELGVDKTNRIDVIRAR
ncbi:MAG: DUF362 domain-containing protein [Verrucomicrobiales bacterium]|nr:DUF362 domain-containing protein [Verrucomicrobiales bacterium]